jgi:hypothetical protein
MSHGYLSDHSAKLCTGSTSRSLSVAHGHEFRGNGHMYQIALQRFTKEACRDIDYCVCGHESRGNAYILSAKV